MNHTVYSMRRTSNEDIYNEAFEVNDSTVKRLTKDVRVLTYNTIKKWSQFTKVDAVEKKPVKQWFKIIFKNNIEQTREVIVPDWVSFYTKNRGYVNLVQLNKICVCLDDQERPNKVVSIERVSDGMPSYFYNLNIKYNSNYYCNGILISTK